MCNTAFRRQQYRERTSVLILCVRYLSCTLCRGNPLLTVCAIVGPFVWFLKSRNWLTVSFHTYSDKNLTQIFHISLPNTHWCVRRLNKTPCPISGTCSMCERPAWVHVTAYNKLFNKMRQETDLEFWHGYRYDISSRKITLCTIGYYEMGFKRTW
jgi:hypothetical protein